MKYASSSAILSSSFATCSVGLFSMPSSPSTSSADCFITFARGSKFL